MTVRPLAVAAASLLLPLSALAADWPAFRGPSHDGTTSEQVAWPKAGPKQLFKVPVGEGFGTVAVSGNAVFLTAEGGGQEALLALDANTGAAKWHRLLGRTIYERQGGNGPRTTPATDGKIVVAYSTWFNLVACDAATGKPLWAHDLTKEFAAQSNTSGIGKWGNASSPVIDGGRVYVFGGGPGQTFLAFDLATGQLAWKSGDEKITHASPTIATIGGVRQVIFFCQSGLVGVDATTGKELWRYAFPFATSTASTPVVGTGKDEGIVYCSAGYRVGAGAVRVTQSADGTFNASEIWRNNDPQELANHWTSCVYKDGHLYGIFGHKQLGTAPLKCVELATGKVKWDKPGFGPGGTILAGDTLVVQGDAGQVAFARATPEGYQATGGAYVFQNAKCWNAAVVANGKLYARTTKPGNSNKDESALICLDVAVK